jgi:hypothetical protein
MRKAPSSVIARSARSVIVLLLEAREADVRKSAADPADRVEKSAADPADRVEKSEASGWGAEARAFPPRAREGIFRAVSAVTAR